MSSSPPSRAAPLGCPLRVRLTATVLLPFLLLAAALVAALRAVVIASVALSAGAGAGSTLDLRIAQVATVDRAVRPVTAWAVGLVAVSALVAALLSWVVLRRTLRRLETATAAARCVGANRLDVRLPLDGPRDEVYVLSSTINSMLDRLGAALDAQERFVANASHELRTPLAVARAALDVPLTQGRVPTDLEPALRRAVAAHERSARILDALLALARNGAGALAAERVDLGALVERVVRERAPAARVASVEVRLEVVAAVVLGDRVLLTQACANLVDNAIVHGRAGGRACVRCALDVIDGRQLVVVEVTNDGPELDPRAVDALREPFHRGPASRTSGPRADNLAAGRRSGTGLGLAVVDEIVQQHGGRLLLHARRPDGLVARIELPAAAADSGR